MIEHFLYFFAGSWLLALIALLAGKYAGQSTRLVTMSAGGYAAIYLRVWLITALAKLAFGYLGYLLQLRDTIQTIYPEFVLPVAAGAYAARQLIKLHARNAPIPLSALPGRAGNDD